MAYQEMFQGIMPVEVAVGAGLTLAALIAGLAIMARSVIQIRKGGHKNR